MSAINVYSHSLVMTGLPARTCGYVVGIKNNKGALTRHLSLVHQREYKLYTAKMEQNWTNGMLEKNLNMRVPSNF